MGLSWYQVQKCIVVQFQISPKLDAKSKDTKRLKVLIFNVLFPAGNSPNLCMSHSLEMVDTVATFNPFWAITLKIIPHTFAGTAELKVTANNYKSIANVDGS